jgi:hypothetical protein
MDTTKPVVELRSAKLGVGDEACVDVVWQAADKNLGALPVDLFYSVNPQGPWTPIAKGVANSGKYRWYLPREVGSQAYVRVIVSDTAGNSTRSDFGQAVLLDDNSRPRAIIGNIQQVNMVVPPQGGGGN